MIRTNNNDFIGFVAADSKDALFAQFGAGATQSRAAYDPDGTATLQRRLTRVGIDRTQAELERFNANSFAGTGVPTYLYRFSYVPTACGRSPQDPIPVGERLDVSEAAGGPTPPRGAGLVTGPDHRSHPAPRHPQEAPRPVRRRDVPGDARLAPPGGRRCPTQLSAIVATSSTNRYRTSPVARRS
jgi:hypothetical protein